jgi:hypothetical protein
VNKSAVHVLQVLQFRLLVMLAGKLSNSFMLQVVRVLQTRSVKGVGATASYSRMESQMVKGVQMRSKATLTSKASVYK